jgi:hypothetical protein
MVIPVPTIQFHMTSMIMVKGHGAIGSEPTGGANGLDSHKHARGAFAFLIEG